MSIINMSYMNIVTRDRENFYFLNFLWTWLTKLSYFHRHCRRHHYHTRIWVRAELLLSRTGCTLTWAHVLHLNSFLNDTTSKTLASEQTRKLIIMSCLCMFIYIHNIRLSNDNLKNIQKARRQRLQRAIIIMV